MSEIKLHLGDCLDILRDMPDNSVDAVITDPPYGVNVAEWDNDVPYELLTEFLRVANYAVVWFGSAPRMIADAKSFPVEPDRVMVWAPKFTLSKIAKDGFAYRFHPLYWWRIRKQKSIPWDLFNDNTECGNWWKHKCTKPTSLMANIVSAATIEGELILDPFMGSGTTGVACIRTGRKFIGIEIEPKYYEIAEKRINDEKEKTALLDSVAV